MMKKLINVFTVVLFTVGISQVHAQDKPTTSSQEETTQQEPSLDNDEEKVEISPMELPDEARRDIVDNYHNGEIVKAYKLMLDGEMNGYLAEVKKGPKVWYVRFDKKGNAENKVNPK